MAAEQRSLPFPAGFRWGTATSAHQVEGDNAGNDWWAWERTPGRILHGHRSGSACEWWAGRAEEDFDRAAAMQNNAHRLSVEWSRVEPAPGRWDERALDRYRQIIRALRVRGIEPLVTLHHFTNPAWLADMGGWATRDVVPLFQRYARKVVETLRDRVDLWCTINEPNVYLFCAYLGRVFPPGRRDLRAAVSVARHLVDAHASAYHAIHEIQPTARVSFPINVRIFDPANPSSPLDRLAARYHHLLFNELFLLAAHDGRLRLPLWAVEVPGAARTMDFVGLNYYTRDLVAFRPLSLRNPIRRFPRPGAPVSDGGYGEIYPEGMYRALRRVARLGLPVYITENGLPDAADRHRQRFLVTHLSQVWRALREGIPVMGYYHWSLVDNFEWERGWTQRFGLWEMDPETQVRAMRESGGIYARICRENAVPADLLERYARGFRGSDES